MSTYLQIENLNKEEFISIIENVVEKKINASFKANKPKNLSVQEVAKLLNVSELTVYNYIKKGWIPASKLGRKHFIKATDLEESLKEVKSLKYRRDV